MSSRATQPDAGRDANPASPVIITAPHWNLLVVGQETHANISGGREMLAGMFVG
jgi:hypothetical protein